MSRPHLVSRHSDDSDSDHDFGTPPHSSIPLHLLHGDHTPPSRWSSTTPADLTARFTDDDDRVIPSDAYVHSAGPSSSPFVFPADGAPHVYDDEKRPATGEHSHVASSANSSDDETDDFNWESSDDDPDAEVDRDGVRRIRAKRGRRLYLALMNLARPVRILIIGLFGTAIAMVPFIVVLLAFRDNPVTPQVQVWSIWISIIWAASCGTFLVLNLVPHLLERIAIGIWGKVPVAFGKYVEVFKATLIWFKLVLCIAWAWISLGGVVAIQFNSTTKIRPSYFRYIFLTIQALFGSSVILLAEKVLLRLIATNFHRTAVADRLETNKKALKALDKLHESAYVKGSTGASRRMTPMWGRLGFGQSRPASPGPNTPGAGHASKPSRDGLGGYFAPAAGGSGPAATDAPQPRHGHHHRAKESQGGSGAKTPTLDAHGHPTKSKRFAHQLTDALHAATNKDGRLYKGRTVGSQQSARRLARKLFINLGHHRDTLVADDFLPYFKTDAEAREAFGFFDADKNGDISKSEMRDAVQRIYRERRALATSLRDMGSAVSKLDGVLLGLVLIIVVFIWLLIFNRSSTLANIVPLSTFVVGFSFVFGNSAKTIFESMIFIFATHPYDVGDLVCIDENWMFVESFGMLSTTFRTVTNQYIVAPNSLLASQKYIFNSRRSGATWEVTYLQLSFDTLVQTIDELRARLRAFVKENDRDWGGGLDVNYDQVSKMNSVSLIIAMEHKGNWQDWGARWARRTKLMRHIKTVCDELSIEYQLPPQPVTFHPQSGRAPFQAPASARGTNLGAARAAGGMSSASGATGGGGPGGGMMPVGLSGRRTGGTS